MATFIWPPEVRWPPPANILLNYEVVAPGDVAHASTQSSETTEEEPMTKIVIVGEAYYSDLAVGGGPVYPSHIPGFHPDHGLPQPGGPVDPGWSGGSPRPVYPWGGGPGVMPPIYHPGHPDHGKPIDPGWSGGVAGPHPSHGLPGGQGGYPTNPWAPPAGEDLPPPPEDIADDFVMALWSPVTQSWTVTTSPAAQPK